jgi:hypothetical protein
MKVVSLEKLREKVKSLMFDVSNILGEISGDDIIIADVSAPEKKPRKPRKEKKVVEKDWAKVLEPPKPKRGRKPFYKGEPVKGVGQVGLSEGDSSLK